MWTVAALLLCALWPVLVDGFTSAYRHGFLWNNVSAPEVGGCEALASAHHLHLAKATDASQPGLATLHCSLALSSRALQARFLAQRSTRTEDEPSCSPVCSQQLDVVVVLGLRTEMLESAGMPRTRRMASALLQHFELGHSHGSLFGFIDASLGVDATKVVAPLGSSRQTLLASLEAWRPASDAVLVNPGELERLGESPAMLSMLRESRSGIKNVLLVLGTQHKDGKPSGGSSKVNTEHKNIVQDKRKRVLPWGRQSTIGLSTVLAQPGSAASAPASDEWNFNWDVMEALLSVCPAVALDPAMKCGRMRWGKSEGKSSTL